VEAAGPFEDVFLSEPADDEARKTRHRTVLTSIGLEMFRFLDILRC
jgi:hypothetical protein